MPGSPPPTSAADERKVKLAVLFADVEDSDVDLGYWSEASGVSDLVVYETSTVQNIVAAARVTFNMARNSVKHHR